MTVKSDDRVAETTTTSGTGTLNLDGAKAGFQAFGDSTIIASGDKVYYAIEDGNNAEVGIGTFTNATPDTLSRDTVLLSIEGAVVGASKITLSGSAATVFATVPGRKIIFRDENDQAQFTAGSATTPSITRVGDVDTGLYFPAADQIAAAIAGAFGMQIDADGLGVGDERVGAEAFEFNDTIAHDVTKFILTARHTNGSMVSGFQTTSVTTTAKTIAGSGGVDGIIALVTGDDGAGRRFCEIVVSTPGQAGTGTTVIGGHASATPAARTFTIGQPSRDLQMAMASGTYTVACFWFGMAI
jgi:hypothetical protein